ncbi:hypothetical protein MferCBS31731_003769 [Microsporum ferrugineum]
MATAKDVQSLLRFLTQDARVPLAAAIGKVKGLQQAKLLNPEDISKAKLEIVQSVFTEDKIGKQVWHAAKRVVKKRLADGDPESPSSSSPSKKRKVPATEPEITPECFEASLTLPISTDLDEISKTSIITNRAPLVLAFAVISLKYTMPEQPLSSRLSLAQAVVSANSRTKARRLGIDTTPSTEDEGWAQGQPIVKVLGRSISVLRRVGYDWRGRAAELPDDGFDSKKMEGSSSSPHAETDSPALRADAPSPKQDNDGDNLPALWGLDLESHRKSSDGHHNRYGGYDSRSHNTHLPVFRPESARDYLLGAFCTHSPSNAKADSKSAKERALSVLLGAIDHVCQSWASTLSKGELDRRAWCWYVAVRPVVEDGVSGWGQKGKVHLSAILDLRRT